MSRPNRSTSRVLQVRLSPEEMEALERIAKRRKVPVSTVAREQLLGLIAEEAASASDLHSSAMLFTVNSLVALSSHLQEMVTHTLESSTTVVDMSFPPALDVAEANRPN
ncbi:hypothetical protein [[Mycobacterium] manitobense]|uniref:hypothetical protein n=1 Tax=[Mycobacterium] manitobense TaxID=190147 RepID=UPI0021F26EE4|nr:hypothetical protein [[Mycobacterium] manitobense]